jgi:hypothetical protein
VLTTAHLPISCSTITRKDGLGLSLIHFFAIGNCTEAVSLLLGTGCNVNKTDSQDLTPLHWAAYFGHKEVLCLLLDREADKNLKDSNGRTAYGISLFVGEEQLNGLLELPLTQASGNTMGVAQQFDAYYDSCQRVSSLRLLQTLRKTAHVCVASTSREALSAIEKGQKVRCGREVVHKIADAVLEMEGVGHRVTVFLAPGDKSICGVSEAKRAARAVIDNGSELTAAPAERVRELSGVLRLVKAEQAKGLHTNEDDVCVKYYT